MVRFLLCIAAIWCGATYAVLNGRIPVSFGLRLAFCLTLWAVAWGGNEKYVKKLINFRKRGCYYCKLFWKFASQAAFAEAKEQSNRYNAINKRLSEDSIRQWIMEELQEEVKRHGVDVVFMFSDEKEAERRLKRIAETTDYYTVKDVEVYLRDIFPNRFAETVAREFFPRLCIGEQMDVILFFPQNIYKEWRYWDFARIFDPENVVKTIVRHEVRHYMQLRALRSAGGAALVEFINNRRKWLPYGMDALESDAFRCQFDSERSIDEFLEEALIEAA